MIHLLSLALLLALVAVGSSHRFGISRPRFVCRNIPKVGHNSQTFIRGGASFDGDSSDDSECSDDIVVESDDEVEFIDDGALKSSLKEATIKSSKTKISSSLKSRGKRKHRSIPYIITVLLSPSLTYEMVQNYFKSLINPDFPRVTDGGASELRSAVERRRLSKAAGGRQMKRRMKPGKAKTLSDLPKLNQ